MTRDVKYARLVACNLLVNSDVTSNERRETAKNDALDVLTATASVCA